MKIENHNTPVIVKQNLTKVKKSALAGTVRQTVDAGFFLRPALIVQPLLLPHALQILIHGANSRSRKRLSGSV